MNILLINHYAGSPELGMEFRPYYLAKKWTEQGHKVTILAASYSHLRKKQPQISTKIHKQNIDGISYIWIQTPDYQGNGMARLKNMFAFVKKINSLSRSLSSEIQPDAVIASSTYPMDIYPAWRIAKFSGAKLIFEIHDLWPLSPMELGGYSRFHPFIAMLQYFENMAFKKADAVISILPKTLEHCVNHGLQPDKWHYVPNGIFLDEYKNTSSIPEHYIADFETFKQQGKKIIGYAGGHALSNALDVLIETAKILQKNDNFLFVLVGNGTEKKSLIKKAQDLDNIKFYDPIPKTAMQNLLKYFDFLYIGWHRSSLYRFGISPNKIFDYMMAKKPIIHSIEAGNDPVKEANAGISIEPENPQAIADAILKLSEMPKKQLEELGENGQKYVLENHDYTKLSNRFLEILQK